MNEVRDGWHGDVDQNADPSVSALTMPIPEVASGDDSLAAHEPLSLC